MAPVPAVTFQVNLNSDGSFKNLKTDATDPEMLNVIKGWASMMQVKNGNGKRSYVSEKEVGFKESTKNIDDSMYQPGKILSLSHVT